MTRQRKFGSLAAIGGSIAAIVLLAGSSAARADELADLRANQELLQKRIDQLSQAPPPAPGPFVPGFGPETRPPGAPVTTGSFPRSFLIPGTDTSLRIGGLVRTTVQWYASGASNGGQLNNQGGQINHTFFDGPGGTGNLNSIPLNNTIAHSRSSTFDISPRTSRVLLDARTPTAWGEAKAYIEFDWAVNNTNTVDSSTTGVASGWLNRLRKGYATLGGFLAGQETGIMHDPDADPELADQGGMATAAGRARVPQIRYTYQGPYGTVFTAGFENPIPDVATTFGNTYLDVNQIPNIATCTANVFPAGSVVQNDIACLGNIAFFSPLQTTMPDWVATARINQPWGHLQVGGVVRSERLNDGQGLNQAFVGYGGTISGDVHPFSGNPGPLGKDDLGFGFTAGNGIGSQIPNGTGMVATNFGRNLFVPGVGFVNPLTNPAWLARAPAAAAIVNGINVRRAYDAQVRSETATPVGAWIWYQHWWTNELRSTLSASGLQTGFNSNLLGQGSTVNKQLSITHANLFWSPVAFMDFGVEYVWGHRVTQANFKGDSNTIVGTMVVRF